MGAAASDGPVHVCAIAARNYLPRVMVLVESFRRHHPDGLVDVCIVDDRDGTVELGDGVRVLRLDELAMPSEQLHAMAHHYDVLELSTALKPWVLEAAQRLRPGPLLYLDADIEVFGPLDGLQRAAAEHGIALTPHALRPYPHDDRTPTELDIFRSGIYNLGFIGIGPDAGPFLRWWQDRLVVGSVSRPEAGLFTDQKWIDAVPSLFDHTLVTDPGCNVAYWNLHERPLEQVEGGYLAGGSPLVFFHFSGFAPDRPEVLSRHAGPRPRARPTHDPVLAQLCRNYATQLARWDDELEVETGYGWERLGNGIPLDPAIRRVLHQQATVTLRRRGAPFVDPTTEEGLAATMDLLLGPVPPRGLPRYLEAKLDDRPDVRAAYCGPAGYDHVGLAGWLAEHAVAEGEISPPLAEILATIVTDDPSAERGDVLLAVAASVPAVDGAVTPTEVFGSELPPMVSYAQNGEDVVLRRAFHDVERGFYLDVGAADPRRDSVTRHFVEQGWTGVDVEPQPDHAADLRAARPGNVVVEAVVGAAPGRATLHVVPAAPGRSSTDAAAVEAYRELGLDLVPLEVEVVTLAELCERHRPEGPIHFLKVDVEGAEADVVAGGDWERFRPMVVVLEVENSGGEAGALVEAMVERRYRPVVFDGLNRFFVAEEHAELEPRLLAPANVNDRFVWYAHLDRVAALQGEIAALRGQLRPAGGAPGTPAAAAEAPSPRPRPLDRVAAALAPHRRWLAPAGSRREALARRVLSARERRP